MGEIREWSEHRYNWKMRILSCAARAGNEAQVYHTHAKEESK